MHRLPHSLLTRPGRALWLAGILATLSSCVDGPFVRANPNDTGLQFEMRLVSSVDTISPANPTVVFQVVTDPVMRGYDPIWTVTRGGGVISLGNGVYELYTTPTAPASFEVTASYVGRSASRTVIRMPTP
ncbi:MAG: hypothetical protein K8S21_11450 [Gemmatimonadetes bacterium]|nr:hypothetical protein [Gemmatimonadota bacterium]